MTVDQPVDHVVARGHTAAMDTRCDRRRRESEVVREVPLGGWGDEGRPLRTDYEMVCPSCGHEQTRIVTGG